MPHSLIERIENGQVLTRQDAEALMQDLLGGQLRTPEIVRLLTALNARAPEREELVGFALAMRRSSAPVFLAGANRPPQLLDTCGTGGGYAGAFNVSTAAAIVAAAAGAHVAKHGNRSSTSLCGSADVLEHLGVRIDIPLEQAGRAICEIGIGFLFARIAHASMQHAVDARKQIGVRTIFNLLGPLTNPAGATNQIVGVPSVKVIDVIAATLAELGAERAFVVHGADGLGEISLSDETYVADVQDGVVRRCEVTPEDFGMGRAPLEAVSGGTAENNAAIIRKVFAGQKGPRHDIVVVNAAAALVAADIAEDFRSGAELADQAISNGQADEKLSALIAFTRQPQAD